MARRRANTARAGGFRAGGGGGAPATRRVAAYGGGGGGLTAKTLPRHPEKGASSSGHRGRGDSEEKTRGGSPGVGGDLVGKGAGGEFFPAPPGTPAGRGPRRSHRGEAVRLEPRQCRAERRPALRRVQLGRQALRRDVPDL